MTLPAYRVSKSAAYRAGTVPRLTLKCCAWTGRIRAGSSIMRWGVDDRAVVCERLPIPMNTFAESGWTASQVRFTRERGHADLLIISAVERFLVSPICRSRRTGTPFRNQPGWKYTAWFDSGSASKRIRRGHHQTAPTGASESYRHLFKACAPS